MADQDPELRDRQPWQAAYTRDYSWLGEVITKHYHGDDSELPVLAAGNSNGDLPMLAFATEPGRPSLGLLVLHDDPEREFDYTAGAEQALEQADSNDWTVVSINNDWATVF